MAEPVADHRMARPAAGHGMAMAWQCHDDGRGTVFQARQCRAWPVVSWHQVRAGPLRAQCEQTAVNLEQTSFSDCQGRYLQSHFLGETD